MDLPFYFLFGALTALFLSAAFLFQLTAQAREAVDERAWGLLEGLARTAFSLLPNEETEVELPPSLAGCSYEFWVEGNSLHVRVLDGIRRGKEYSLQLAEGVRVENSSFGERIYLRREGRGLVFSSSPLSPLFPSLPSPLPPSSPPPFYSLAKEHPRVAAALLLSFSLFGEPRGYALEGERVFVKLEGGWRMIWGGEREEEVGEVKRAWVIEGEGEGSWEGSWLESPSVGEAVVGGWVLDLPGALSEFTGRTWKWEGGIVRPENLRWKAAVVSTKTGSFPAWRFEFSSGGESFLVYYRMLRWWFQENSSGFFMQSRPNLEPI
ncbi:MAG: hypothetical protein QXZ52_04955 [Candidatus Hadarchaeales archaeon]